jgi:dienelactone hydrolase
LKRTPYRKYLKAKELFNKEISMKKILLTVMMFLIGIPLSYAALKTQTVEYKQGDTVLEGYVAYDDALEGKLPGVLVVHEWKGLDEYAKKRANMLAELGYVAFAADIYGKGVRPQTPEEAGAKAGQYKSDRALLRSRVVAGLEELKKNPNVDPSQVLAIGYCFGGTAVLELARSGADVKGIVSFHGGLSSPTPSDAKNIKAPILVLHGADDPYVPPSEVADFEKEMKEANVDYRLIAYPGAVHGFTNPNNKGEMKGALYDEEADERSWREMQEFFDDVLE